MLRDSNSSLQFLKLRLGTNTIESGIYPEPHHPANPLVSGLLQ
jgi:hypothetical protein